jgi:hypothetical protein
MQAIYLVEIPREGKVLNMGLLARIFMVSKGFMTTWLNIHKSRSLPNTSCSMTWALYQTMDDPFRLFRYIGVVPIWKSGSARCLALMAARKKPGEII